MIDIADVVYGLAWGDEGKGKVSAAMAHQYDWVCRWNGGPNAGHTVWVDGKKHKTHIVPSGIFAGKPCLIGSGCVINPDKFFVEIRELKQAGFDTSLVKIHPNVHIITEAHITHDKQHLGHLGTTGQGIAPCYSDKMLRRGIRAIDCFASDWIWNGEMSGKILCEGAQSVWLDIDHGDYPYVTSSTTLPYGACSIGFSPKRIGRLIGVAKAYDTKSGVDPLFPETLWEDPQIDALIREGGEYGTTTGRKRLANWLNLDKLISAVQLSGCTEIIINKCDVLQRVGVYKVFHKGELVQFKDLGEFKMYMVREMSYGQIADLHDIRFSNSPETI